MAFQRARPAFAIASGIARDWRPMHAFCEREGIPCWFPLATELPAGVERDRYGVYFDGGLGLDADVIANQIRTNAKSQAQVLQIVGSDPLSSSAARHLAQALGDNSGRVVDILDPALDAHLSSLGSDDALVLWLRPNERAALMERTPPPSRVYLSTRFDPSDVLPTDRRWAKRSVMVYPYDLPAQRSANLTPLKVWLGTADIPYGDEALQSRTLFAMSFLTECLADMLHNLHRDYLLERAETMLDRREYDASTLDVIAQRGLRRRLDDRNAGPSPLRGADGQLRVTYAELTSERSGSTVYPSLTLGIGQRIASKGAWLLSLGETSLDAATVDTARWIVPR
jgi:hypothetical protein